MGTEIIDVKELAALLRARRGTRGLRSVAEEISRDIGEVSASTLSRVEQGKVPDLDTFVRLCQWLGVSMERLMVRKADGIGIQRQTSTAEVVKAHLRADRTLDPQTSEALANMIQLVYDAAKKGRLGKDKNKK